MILKWQTYEFSSLKSEQLFEILKLRQSVFVVEQNCPYPDIDDTDKSALHLCGWSNDQLAAYARIIPAGISYSHASIGRVVTSKKSRGSGLGRTLMQKAIQTSHENFDHASIKIGAQEHLESFYHSLGFKRISESYLEDGIPHIEMLLK